jgi:hypothetical protein
MGAVRQLIEQAPDAIMRTLESALAFSARQDRSLAPVQDMIGQEILDRRTRGLIFGPLVPLCEPPRDTLPRTSFPRNSLAATWRALKIIAPQDTATAVRTFATLRGDDEFPEIFDVLCRRAAKAIRGREPAFLPLIEMLDAHGKDATRLFAHSLALVPLARRALERLPVWARTLSGEHAAAIRLAFRDAVAIGDDAGPPFMEILFGHLEEPHQVLRLISLVMDRPSDRYLAGSELASFGERLLVDIDRRIEQVRRFDPSRGLEGGVALADSITVATAIIHEFEQWLAIARQGPWGSRLASHKRALAMAVEARLREVETAVGLALPAQPVRSSNKKLRGPPKISADPDAELVVRAQGYLAFLCETRTTAGYGGFGAVRAKVVEALDPRIDQYAEDLLELLHNGEGGPVERVKAYLEITAEFLGLVRDPKAAEIIRRRTAVA